MADKRKDAARCRRDGLLQKQKHEYNYGRRSELLQQSYKPSVIIHTIAKTVSVNNSKEIFMYIHTASHRLHRCRNNVDRSPFFFE